MELSYQGSGYNDPEVMCARDQRYDAIAPNTFADAVSTVAAVETSSEQEGTRQLMFRMKDTGSRACLSMSKLLPISVPPSSDCVRTIVVSVLYQPNQRDHNKL